MRLLATFAALTLLITPLEAQAPLAGFTAASAARELALEARLMATPDTAHARRFSRDLSRVPHVAGTPEQQLTADYVLRQMRSWGLDTGRADFRVFLPYPDSTIVERVRPSRLRLSLEEPALPEDPSSQGRLWPAMNGTSGSGDVTAPLVYVNYGLPADYAVLDSLGLSVRGRVVIARYGRSFRGIKAREAEARGAAALILYSDPQDDGYVPGDVYPDGPMRNADGVQRGSVYNGEGDPSTPGWASVAGARRLPEDSMDISRIPVVPIGYRNAGLLMADLRGPGAPRGWQGGLPFHYHLGDREVTVRVGLWHEHGDRAYKTITNTFGTIRGTDWPDELLIVGGHRDAWGPGASDDVSGVVAILEAARAWGEASQAGFRPKRTLVFATWDAEEWGTVGSTEWVESREPELSARGVAYLNLDEGASGRAFGAGATASLQPLIRDITRLVTQPGDTVSVYTRWRANSRTPDSLEVRLGDLGGGSDFAAFYNHLGVPSLGFGFGGPGGVYHSAYDSYTWMDRFGDPGFLAHAASARLAALALARLADADIVPFDYANFGRYLGELGERAGRLAENRRMTVRVDSIVAAADALREAGEKFAAARDEGLRAGLSRNAVKASNAELRMVERELTSPAGLPGRPWMRNLIFASDRDNGYADIALPALAEAIQSGDSAAAAASAGELATRIRAAALRVDAARAALLRQ